MPKEEQAKVDLTSYIPTLRKFNIFLGLSMLVIGLVLYFLVSKNAALMFACIYPILAYAFFVFQSSQNTSGRFQKKNRLGAIALLFVAVMVGGLFYWGMNETQISVNDTTVSFKGMYGETIGFQDITSIELIEKLPKTTIKVNGYAMDGVYKGKFKTADEGMVKLIINAENKPYIRIERKDDIPVFFASKDDDNGRIYKGLKEKWYQFGSNN